MRIDLEETDSKGRYVLLADDGSEGGELTFSKLGDKQIIIDHTAVHDDFRGGGHAASLVARAVEDARTAGKRIVPLCPFARAEIERHPEWQDVVAR